MTLRHINIFVTVCECGKVTEAAERLHIAQPAVSVAVSQLEKYYNVSLFDRVGQRLVLTEAGKRLLVSAKQVLDSFDSFEALAKQTSKTPTVKVGSSLTLGKILMPKFVLAVRKECPYVDIRAVIDSTAAIEEKIADGTLDIAFTEGEINNVSVACEQFGEDRLIAVCGRAYEVGKCLSEKDLIGHSWLLREKGSASRDFFDRALAERGIVLQPMIESSSNQALIAACSANIGIAVLPRALVGSELASGELREVVLDGISLSRRSFIVYHKNRTFAKPAEKVLAIGRSVCAQYAV